MLKKQLEAAISSVMAPRPAPQGFLRAEASFISGRLCPLAGLEVRAGWPEFGEEQ